MRFRLIVGISIAAAGCTDARNDGGALELKEVNAATARPDHGPVDALLTTANSDAETSWLTLDPDGRIALFGRHIDGFGDQRIYLTEWDGKLWSTPKTAPFSVDQNERGARFSADGKSVYFASTRPTAEDDTDNDWNIWSVAFESAGTWGIPIPLTEISSPENDFHPSVSSNGTVYFGSRRPDSVGESDMFVARQGPAGWVVESVSDLNTEYSEPDPFIAADGSYLIFARTDAPGGFGGDDLYISYANDDGGWSEPKNLGSAVNTAEYEYGAFVTADSKTLIYTTWASGKAQIESIEMSALGLNWAK